MGLPISQTLAPDGELVAAHDFTPEELRGFHRDLVLARRIDSEAFALQRHGELGLWAPMLGQEAAQIGSGRALAPNDFVFPSYREHAVAWCRGLDPALLLSLFRGTSLGGWDPARYGYALPAIIIGAQTLHAVGYGIGLTLEGKEDAVVAYFGDGATSQGDTNEAFAWAASYNAPVVFFCQNNHYAISIPLERQTRVPIAQRAAGFGFPGVRVDGNDVLAVHQVTTEALAKARSGGGPTLIEAITYRMGAHTTSDDPSRYRDPHEADEWAERDPLLRLRLLLERTDPGFAEFDAEVKAEADELGAHLREVCGNLPDPDLADLFEHVYADLPPELVAQREEVRSWS
ncbi:pyruvate dehydrogenase (acetyl-transferring) E1 component subunit alpha [Aeromicrobium choanae]|uniref:Pyruvate dehydrogenase E1 component alpha subunit n=1 Tax=Aeromicrobium choanae TaxID=1736691 RepID=A0A1T4Z0X0_9ACTN|nr:pyruvate dehydrogenase (acetyl-transferring) E1 component subunit alpha [Aeromicrobium choanae]SKB07606.1 pyruvate dehydrogenase E1 component alpha subunit [Aeromicrobium choanae]